MKTLTFNSFIIVLVIFPSLLSAQCHIQDSIFRQILSTEYAITFDSAGRITNPEKAAKIETLFLASSNINSLEGIDAFVSLKTLLCSSNPIKNLDLTSNLDLETLDCDYCELTSLDVSQNKELRVLSCSMNPIKSLDLTSNLALQTLNCPFCELTSLDLSENKELKYVSVTNNTRFSHIQLPYFKYVRVSIRHTPYYENRKSNALLFLIIGIPTLFLFGFFLKRELKKRAGSVMAAGLITLINVVTTWYIAGVYPIYLWFNRADTNDGFGIETYFILMVYLGYNALLTNLKDKKRQRNLILNGLIALSYGLLLFLIYYMSINTWPSVDGIPGDLEWYLIVFIITPSLLLINVSAAITKTVILIRQKIRNKAA